MRGCDTKQCITFQHNLSTAGYLRWVISQVQEQTHILHGTVLLKVLFEKPSRLHVHLKYTVYSVYHL